jgi:hypothetical protein
MKIAALIARILLGLVFLVFGLNGFHPFLPMGPMPTGLALQYVTALMQSHLFYVIAACQALGGLLLLVNRYVPLALTILGPVIVNILSYHIFLHPKDFALPLVVTVLWLILAYYHRQAFAGILAQRTP